MLKMSCIRFNTRLDTSHLGPPHPCKDAGADADSLTGIHNAIVKCLFVVNRSCIHRGFCVSPQVKVQRIEIWRGAWRPCSGSSSTYPSVILYIMIWYQVLFTTTDLVCCICTTDVMPHVQNCLLQQLCYY
jgi:hypothetical protein